ncbi:FAD-binding oxidoreductase [Micromonospora sp. NPDC048871]|uniref:FAD-binding oxidoreductase n=1 Tax=unclassified Micromonospora TaxID=2617518 RepID=UPI002E12E828|nr:FAD-binding oxidoreductase [Micromonospora sp. NBC_01739]
MTVAIAERSWRRLADELTGRLWLPDQAPYETKRSLFNKRYADVRPAAVASVRTVADIQHCLRWAGEMSLPVVARSSGHSYAGYSVNEGLVIDLSALNTVTVQATTGLVTVGGGTTMADLYPVLQQHQVAFPAGNSPTVGIGGLTLGGGVAAVSRAFGLTCDSLVETTVVTAQGRVLRCDATENPDLFWACRGGGGGNFGINTSFTFQAREVRDVSVFALVWSASDPIELLTVLQRIVAQAPEEFSTRLGLDTSGSEPGQAGQNLRVSAVGLFLGPADELRQLLSPALEVATPDRCHIAEMDYWAGDEFLRHDTSADRFAARTRVTGEPLSAEVLEILVSRLRDWPGSGNPDGAGVGLFSWGGAMNRIPATDTAFVHRDALFLVCMDTSWTGQDPPDRVAANQRWLAETYAATGEHLPHAAYQNFTDPDLRDWQTAYYGVNYPRLVEVKRRHDPDDLFRFDQSIGS